MVRNALDTHYITSQLDLSTDILINAKKTYLKYLKSKKSTEEYNPFIEIDEEGKGESRFVTDEDQFDFEALRMEVYC